MGLMIGGVCTTQSANAKAACGQTAEPFGMTSILKYIMTEEVTDEYKNVTW